MRTRTFRLVLALVSLAVAAGYAAQNRPWPPGLQQVPDHSPPLSPEASMKTMHLPPGYRVELVASEPLIQDPVMIDFDPDGRLWAVEMPGYMPDIQASGEHQPIGKIVVLEDTNADGRMDKRTVFQDGLVLARWLKVLDRGVLVAEPPNLWLFQDTDGDLRADRKELVTDRYGRREANVEHNANSLLWALDNSIYTSEVDIYLRLRNGTFEVRKTVSRGQWGITQDDVGRIYRNTNESALHVDLVPTPYYARHANLLRTRGSHESLTGENGEVNIVWPIRPTRGVNRGYQAGILRPDGTLARFTSVCTPMVYRGDRLPAELYGSVFVVDPTINAVSRIQVTDSPNGLVAQKVYADVRGEFLASTDERFRPVNLSLSPDGTLYVVDMYRGIIQHKGYMTEYLRDYVLANKLEQPNSLGRIYRIVHDTTLRDTTPMRRATTEDLVASLGHPNGWRGDMAQQLLVERGDKTAAPALIKAFVTAKDTRTRLQALWTLDGLDAIEPKLITEVLGYPHRDFRVAALRIAERWLREPNHSLHGEVLKLAGETDWAVRRQLAATLGELPPDARVPALAAMLERHGDDPVVVDAAISGLQGLEPAVMQRLLQATTETPQRAAAITMLAGTIVRAAVTQTTAARGSTAPGAIDDAAVQGLLRLVAEESRPAWQRAALLRGAEVALLGALMPGNPPPRSANPNAPCPTCPGGRGEPRGSRAFPGSLPAAQPAARGGRGGGPSVRLNSEPALTSLATGQSDLAVRARAVLARLEWPGRPAMAAAPTPLTPVEQKRFAAGEALYANHCEACHGEDGREQQGIAAALLGAPGVLGSPQVPIRVLLHGKEGPIGLMPPQAEAMNDDEIAAVLTYIRRAWGQTGSPVDTETVAAVRKATAGRTRAWTQEELSKLE